MLIQRSVRQTVTVDLSALLCCLCLLLPALPARASEPELQGNTWVTGPMSVENSDTVITSDFGRLFSTDQGFPYPDPVAPSGGNQRMIFGDTFTINRDSSDNEKIQPPPSWCHTKTADEAIAAFCPGTTEFDVISTVNCPDVEVNINETSDRYGVSPLAIRAYDFSTIPTTITIALTRGDCMRLFTTDKNAMCTYLYAKVCQPNPYMYRLSNNVSYDASFAGGSIQLTGEVSAANISRNLYEDNISTEGVDLYGAFIDNISDDIALLYSHTAYDKGKIAERIESLFSSNVRSGVYSGDFILACDNDNKNISIEEYNNCKKKVYC